MPPHHLIPILLLTWRKLTPALLFLTLACTCDSAREPPPPDVTGIRAPLELIRFDRALATIDTAEVASGMATLDHDYGEFADLYLRHITPVRRGDFSPEEQLDVMKAMLTYEPLRRLDSTVQARFDDNRLTELKNDLQRALRYYRYYLPDAPVPDTLVTFYGEFSYAALLYGDNNLAAGLEFYLGPDFDYAQISIQEAIFSNYLARTYRPEYFSQKLMHVVIEDHVPRPRSGRLIDYLIYEGKKLYLLGKVLPETADSIVHEVTGEQMAWLRDNEVAIYAHLQKENLFFDTSPDLVRKLTQPAPYTQGMPRESPGRAVNYLGEKIVTAYVAANPTVTMAELLAIKDGQKFLTGARYKPKG